MTSEIGQIIRSHREAKSLSLQSLAAQIGCAKSYLSMIETGIRGDGGAAVDPHLLERLESALALVPGTLTRAAQWSATPPDVRTRVAALESTQRDAAAQIRSLMGQAGRSLDAAYKSGRLGALVARLEGGGEVEGSGGDAPRPHHLAEEPQEGGGTRLLPLQVPLINSVAAGYPREFTDLGYPARVAAEYVRSPDIDDPDAFAARVVGDSMSPDYREGDIVVFSPARPVRSGTDCFVRLERDEQTTFKRVVFEDPVPQVPVPQVAGASPATCADVQGRPPHQPPTTMIRLVPLNPAYPQRSVPREDVAFLCAAVSVTRKIGG